MVRCKTAVVVVALACLPKPGRAEASFEPTAAPARLFLRRSLQVSSAMVSILATFWKLARTTSPAEMVARQGQLDDR